MNEEQFKKAFLSQTWKFLTEDYLRSVLTQESRQVSTFKTDEKLYKANMEKAKKLLNKTEVEILALIKLGNGSIPKFRPEPGEFKKAKWSHLTPVQKLFNCSSWGLGQVMGYNILQGKPAGLIPAIIKLFSEDEYAQVLWTAKELDRLLIKSKGDMFKAYCYYNGGSKGPSNPSSQARATEVMSRL
jgi:hypothetical protein